MENNDLSQIVLLDQLYQGLCELKNREIEELVINKDKEANILLDLIIPVRNQLIDDFTIDNVCKILKESGESEGYITHLRKICQNVCYPTSTSLPEVKTPKKIDFKDKFFRNKDDCEDFFNIMVCIIKDTKNETRQEVLMRAHGIIFAVAKAYKLIK